MTETRIESRKREDGETLVFVAPAPGRTVPRPDGQAWTQVDGEIVGDWVAADQYIRRRIADGDLAGFDSARADKLIAAALKKAQAEAEVARSSAAAAETGTATGTAAPDTKKKG